MDEPIGVLEFIEYQKQKYETRIAELEKTLKTSKEVGRKLANHNADLIQENATLREFIVDYLPFIKAELEFQELDYIKVDEVEAILKSEVEGE